MTSNTYFIKAAENELLPCEVQGCSRRRHSTARICQKHMLAVRLWGNVHGKAVRDRNFLDEGREIRRLIDLNTDHPAVNHFRTWWAGWIQMSLEHPSGIPLAPLVAEFKPEEGEDLLVKWGALWLWKVANPLSTAIMDEHSFGYHQVKLMAQYRPKPVKHRWHFLRIPQAQRRAGAQYVRQNTMPLIKAFKVALDAEEAERRKLETTLEAQPLTFNKVGEV
jgi:hypothetical protein